MAAKRAEWTAAQPTLDPARPKFVDGTWAGANMARCSGRGPRGWRPFGTVPVPHGHGKTTTFVAALCLSGMIAPTVVDGAINGDPFPAWVEQRLTPALRAGDVVVMGNLASHKRPAVPAASERAGCRSLLSPPYGPDLNPIELAFSKLEAMLRRAAKRTVEGPWDFLGEATEAFSPEERRNLLRHCEYGSTARPGCIATSP